MELSKPKNVNGILALLAGAPALTLNGLLVIAVYRNINAGANTLNGQNGFERKQAGPIGPGNGALIVNISGPTSSFIQQSVTETATVSGGTAPFTYTWSWGDGTQSTGQSSPHSWLTPGTYRVTLAVRDSAGNGGAIAIDFIVSSPAVT